MIRFIYNLFWPIGLLFFLPSYLVKMIRRGGYGEKFGQRLGIYDCEVCVRLSKQKPTWLHAVSVGEVNVALKLANSLRALEPALHCVLTTTTTTGFALANKNAPAWIEVIYTLLDYWPIMRRAFAVIRPTRLVLIDADRQRPVLFGGSTHRGEEEILAKVFLRLRQQFSSLRLFIAPRHLERLREIRAQLAALPLRVALASEVAIDRESDADCILLDTTGELQRWYGIATIVFVGKSLTAQGGQNPVEPIMAGKPVVFGPHMENFATLAKALVLKKGAIQVRDADSLEMTIAGLLRDGDARERLLENARDVVDKHHGATARAAALIHQFHSRL